MPSTTSLKRRAFLEDGLRSREAVERTGLVYPHEEVARWFRALARGEKARKPRPVTLKRVR